MGDILRASDAKIKEAPYVGDIRARQIKRAAETAVLEYLAG